MHRLLDMLRNLKVIPIGSAPSGGSSVSNTEGNTDGNTKENLVGFNIISNFSLPSITKL